MSQFRHRSWVDGLIAGIERVPGPPWIFYAAVGLLLAGVTVALHWLDGSVPVGEVDWVPTLFALAAIYCLAVVHYLNRAARRSLAQFSPALGELEPQRDAIETRLTTMPQWSAMIAVVIGLAVNAIGLANSGGRWGVSEANAPWTIVFTIATQVVLNVFFWVFVIRTARQLSTIVQIHRDATAIRLSDAAPHNAFARFTLVAAIAVSVPYALLEIFVGVVSTTTVVEIVILVLILLLSLAVFVLPLSGMHGRLVREKTQQLAESHRMAEVAAGRLHSEIESGKTAQIEVLGAALSALSLESDRIRRVSTWPWSADTIRGFLSSITLPVLVFLITTILGRYL